MKKIVLLIVLLSVGVWCAAAQKPTAPVKSIKSPTPMPIVKEFSNAEWKVLTDSVKAEDWTKSAAVAADYLEKLKTDNDKKQLAQLRYLRLFALAGKILAVSAANVPANTDALWKELDDAASAFNGREFVLPPHLYLHSCINGAKRAANYICPVAGDERALRITATNKEGTAIHSFDYVAFDDKNSIANLPESELFLGGILRRVEYNQNAAKPWVMRLIFDKGFASVVAGGK
ncbi:MAG: hypothetical protein M3T96_04410 [Acidobacteriota bacterium]|nr:hypothetical protein [Acidobacteriota bacterium]